MTKFQALLEKLNACQQARNWVGNKTLAAAWKTATNPSWMLWLYERSTACSGYVAAGLAMQFAAAALESAGLVAEAESLRPFFVVTAKKQAAARAAARAAADSAADAAWAATWAAKTATWAAGDAARAARAAADSAADSAAADSAADAAADSAAAWDARAADAARSSGKKFCDIIRETIKVKDLKF